MKNLKENLADLKNSVRSGELTMEDLQKALSRLLLSDSSLPNVEKVAKKFDNDLELVIYTLTPSNQIEAAQNVIDEVILYIDKNSVD